MKRKPPASKSTYRAILSVQNCRDQASGLYVSDRFFQPQAEPRSHWLAWFLADVLVLACLAIGLLMLVASGFSVPVSRWFFPGAFFLCVGLTACCRSSWSRRHWLATGIGFVLAYLLTLFLCQDAFFQGAGQFRALMAQTLQRTYNAEQAVAWEAVGADRAEVFLFLISVPAMMWLAVSLFGKNTLLMAFLLLFPVLALTALCGAAQNMAALLLVLLGGLLCMAYSRPKRQLRMWGGRNRELYRQNRRRFQSVQKKNTLLMLLVFLLLAAPGFFLVRPLLSYSLKPVQQLSVGLQGSFLTKVMKLLPELTAGEWNLSAEAVGGGVQDGALSSQEGYLLEGVEDLKLTLSAKPGEAIFLKGFVGTVYENGKWEPGHGTSFDGAAINWNTEGSARLYIQNLPFLRTAFALNQSRSEKEKVAEAMGSFSAEPVQLLVERLNANDDYTYLPYGAYLNDYYQISAGDGAVEGQSEQEDRFFFFFREDMQSVLSAWNDLEGTGNVLDRVEESYRAFCEANNRGSCAGMEQLQAEIDAVLAENHWTAAQNGEEITTWIRRYLAEHYRYRQDPQPAPEGVDPLEYFLSRSKEGNSVHFASAAVVLYRLFGVPARYVVGYEVPASLFSAQANGTYTATVQGDNAQAWAEIYVPGIGWTPRDMTPGVIGTYEEVGPGGEKIEALVDGGSETEGESVPESEETLPENREGAASVESGGSGFGAYSLEQLITVFMYLVPTILLVAGLILFGRQLCRALGYDPFHRHSRQQRLVFVFQALYSRMGRLGLPREADSQSEEFLQFCEKELSSRCPERVSLLRPTVERLYQICFGGEKASQGDISAMRRLLLASFHSKR